MHVAERLLDELHELAAVAQRDLDVRLVLLDRGICDRRRHAAYVRELGIGERVLRELVEPTLAAHETDRARAARRARGRTLSIRPPDGARGAARRSRRSRDARRARTRTACRRCRGA